MAAGVRSLLAFWAGGAAVPAAVSQGGVRSLLAPWMGGATAPAVVEQGGVRGLLAFWMGGAAPGAAVEEEDTGGGLFPRRDYGAPLREQAARRKRREEEEAEALATQAAAEAIAQIPSVDRLAALLAPTGAAREAVSAMSEQGTSSADRVLAASLTRRAKDKAQEDELMAVLLAALEAMDD